MSRAVEGNLFSLLPTHSGNFPEALVGLASSLLAQSRHSSTLKQDEEIARSYACCHIACERLKIQLDLPTIQARPPVPPKVYKRVYTYLDKVLPEKGAGRASRTRTPSSKLNDSTIFSTPSRSAAASQPQTPTVTAATPTPKKPSTSAPNGPRSSTRKPPSLIPAKRKAGGQESLLPAWIRPSIQHLCTTLDEERIGRTVLAGMQSIATPHGRASKDEWITQNLTPLLAAVYFLVSLQVRHLETGKQPDDKEYRATRKAILQALSSAQEEVKMPRGMDEDEMWIGWTDVTSRDVDGAVDWVVEGKWQDGEWFKGLTQVVRSSSGKGGEDVDVEMGDAEGGERGNAEEEEDDGKLAETMHMRKSDTMLQSRWVMTQKKKIEYARWKEEILARIEGAEQVDGVVTQPQAMEVRGL